jgi:hypothetical protein
MVDNGVWWALDGVDKFVEDLGRTEDEGESNFSRAPEFGAR